MKKIFFLVMLGCSLKSMAKRETIDITTYDSPGSWKKDIKQGLVLYSNVNTTTGGYCVIGIYVGVKSEGDAEKDFKKEWKDLAVTPYKADANAKPETVTTADGKFTDKGALNILNHQTMDPFNITKEAGNGTYMVKDFTLVCNYTDGRKVQIVFIGEGYSKKNAGPATLTLSFNNDVLYKK